VEAVPAVRAVSFPYEEDDFMTRLLNASQGGSRRLVLAELVVLLWAIGCSGQGPRTEVEGVVRCGGETVPGVVVVFTPDFEAGGRGTPAAAVTDDEGHYALQPSGSGAGNLFGTCRVTVAPQLDSPLPPRPDRQGVLARRRLRPDKPTGIAPPTTVKVQPPKGPRIAGLYGDVRTTPLRAELKPGVQTVNLDLK
jgi:hypothetical protein